MRIHRSEHKHELLFAAAKKNEERKTIENGQTKQIRHHGNRMLMRACEWALGFHLNYAESKRETDPWAYLKNFAFSSKIDIIVVWYKLIV